MTSSVKCLRLYYFRYILASVSGLPYLQKPWVSYHHQTKLSPVYNTFTHVDGEAKNFKKKLKCLHCFMLRTFPRSWHSLCVEICENKDSKTEGRFRAECNACSHFGVEREFYGVWKPLPLVWNHLTRRKCFTTKQYKFLSRIWMKKRSLVPSREKRFSFCPPTWPPWLQLQTSNTDKKLFVFKQKRLDICMCPRKTILEI